MIGSDLFHLAASCTTTGLGLPGLYDNLPGGCGATGANFTTLSDIWIVIANVVRILVALSGALAVIFIIIGGIFYIISAGDPSQTKRAKEIIKQAITGLVIMIIAYPVITFISSRF